MSIELSDVLVKKFENEAIQAFQDGGTELRNYVRLRDAKGAQKVQFNVIGKGLASERTAIQTPIPVMDVAHTPKTATVKNYVASELTDIFLNNQVGFDERQELAQTIGMSLNRRLDQVIVDELNRALAASEITKTVANNVSGSADNLNVAMLNDAARQLGSDVPEMDRALVCHDSGFYHLLLEDNVKDYDINARKPLVDGQLPNYHGFAIKKMGDRSEGGLTVDGSNDRTNFAWQKQAIGLAMNMEPMIRIDWEPSYGAHRITGYLSAGAVLIQPEGAVAITSRES
jgi:hypothetical protein